MRTRNRIVLFLQQRQRKWRKRRKEREREGERKKETDCLYSDLMLEVANEGAALGFLHSIFGILDDTHTHTHNTL